MIQRAAAAREGRRFHAFYLGRKARREGQSRNPYAPGSALATCWANGWRYGECDR
ncbi:MAG: hypothetical protein ACOC93_00100 [Planctomycetota bacterium]